MRNKTALLSLIFYLLYPANFARSEEAVEIKFETLPDAVQKTALIFLEKQQISKTTKITDNGHVKYEIMSEKIENKKDVITQNIMIADNGKIMKLSRQVPYFALTFEQMQEIEKHYPAIRVDEVKSVETHYYDVLGTVNGQKTQFRIFENNAIEELKENSK